MASTSPTPGAIAPEAPPPPVRMPSSFEDEEDKRKPDYNFPVLAEKVGLQPGLSIFRRFGALNAKSLLYLQAELGVLEDQLRTLEQRDARDPEKREFQWSPWEMMHVEPGEDKQWQKVLEIRAKLKEYNALLIQQAALHKLEAPNAYDLQFLRDFLWRDKYGGRFAQPPEDAWGDEFLLDLVTLSRRDKEGDVFSRWFSSTLWPWIHRNILHPPEDRTVRSVLQDIADNVQTRWHHVKEQGQVAAARARQRRRPGQTPDDDPGAPGGLVRQGTTIVAKKTAEGAVLYEYPDRRLNRATEVLSITASSLLPTVSIIALNYIPAAPPIYRLAFILGFSGFFTLCLSLFTEARRIEIFGAAVALASVQVVFIGTTGQGGVPSSSTG